MADMFDIEAVLAAGEPGEGEEATGVLAYLKSFDHIVLRGAGFFGAEFGKRLLAMGVPKDKLVYWDLRAKEIGETNGIPVRMPYREELPKDRTLVINCIPNGVAAGRTIKAEVEEQGFANYVFGAALYEALFCEVNLRTGFDAKYCLATRVCNWNCCKRLTSLVGAECQKHGGGMPDDDMVFSGICFDISQLCSLQCKHCGQYMNSYTKEERINFPYERIKTDSDRFFDAVDVVGFLSVVGGEPFLHPDFSRIIDHLMTKRNFGIMGITTNGICRITREHLASLANGRTRVIFSDYTGVLSDTHKKLFQENVAKVREAGINLSVGTPIWITPPTLRYSHLSLEVKTAMKSSCHLANTCRTVHNGVYYPCSGAVAVMAHKVADYPTDYVRIDDALSTQDLRRRIKAVNRSAFYRSCEHCWDGGEALRNSAEQGCDERYGHLDRVPESRE
jgi:hypothetical protein